MKILITFLCLLLLGRQGYTQCNTSYIVSQGKPSWSSSQENASYPSSNAFDGNRTTRWSSAYRDNEFLAVDLGEVMELCLVNLYWETALGRDFTIDLSNDSLSWTTAATITGNVDLRNSIPIAGFGRYVRMHGLVRGTGHGFSLFGMHVFGTAVPSSCPSTNLALGMPAVASSTEASAFPASSAFDGSNSTRWSSQFSDTQSLYVDLAGNYALCKVTLQWEGAYGANFSIDGSSDAVIWHTLATVVGNTSLTNIIPLSANARYVRLNATKRATSYGYSLYEFSVQGGIVLPVRFESLTAKVTSRHQVGLTWAAESEQAINRFEVQRSRDGTNFETIHQGDFPVAQRYLWVDQHSIPGTSYYRVRQIEPNGASTFSKIVPVSVPREGFRIAMYPNPVADQLQIDGEPGNSIGAIDVFDRRGTRVISNNTPITLHKSISFAGLPPGVYWLAIKTANDGIRTSKIVKR